LDGLFKGCWRVYFGPTRELPARPFRQPYRFSLHVADSQLNNAAAPISARQKIANAIHIVVTFDFRFGAHYGLNSDIAACPRCANFGSRPTDAAKRMPPEGGSPN
jgi:hypothetical protein